MTLSRLAGAVYVLVTTAAVLYSRAPTLETVFGPQHYTVSSG